MRAQVGAIFRCRATGGGRARERVDELTSLLGREPGGQVARWRIWRPRRSGLRAAGTCRRCDLKSRRPRLRGHQRMPSMAFRPSVRCQHGVHPAGSRQPESGVLPRLRTAAHGRGRSRITVPVSIEAAGLPIAQTRSGSRGRAAASRFDSNVRRWTARLARTRTWPQANSPMRGAGTAPC